MPKSSNIVLPESRVFSALWGGAHTTIRCLNQPGAWALSAHDVLKGFLPPSSSKTFPHCEHLTSCEPVRISSFG
jgi:hypothetical protein